MPRSAEEFIETAKQNDVNTEILKRLPPLDLPQCYLTAGCLFQTAWNQISGQPPDWGVKDYDIFYFDPADLSWEAEDAVIRQTESLLTDLNVTIEVKNQARVHLWYQNRFNAAYPQLSSSRDGIDRYLVACTCIGIDVATGELYAPYGLDDVYDGLLRVNPLNSQPLLFQQKAEHYRKRWPWLRIIGP